MSRDDNTAAVQGGDKPLAQKTDAELKREAKARLKHLGPIAASQLVNEVVGKQAVGGFVGFLREHAVVGLAVGFVLGSQIQAVVKQLNDQFIVPLFQLLLPSGTPLANRTFYVHFGSHAAKFGWGAFVYALIDFFFVALTIYIIIKLFQLDKVDKKQVEI